MLVAAGGCRPVEARGNDPLSKSVVVSLWAILRLAKWEDEKEWAQQTKDFVYKQQHWGCVEFYS